MLNSGPFALGARHCESAFQLQDMVVMVFGDTIMARVINLRVLFLDQGRHQGPSTMLGQLS